MILCCIRVKNEALTAFPVCPDSSIIRNAPMMVQRILNILAESKNIWPLAARWYDHLERFHKSHNMMTVGAEGSMADSVSVPNLDCCVAVSDMPQREPIPHVLHPTPNRPTVKPIQPRPVAPKPDEKNGVPAQSPKMSMLALPPHPDPAIHTDPNLRLPGPQQTAPTPPATQQAATPHGQALPQPQAAGSRSTTDGLGLLIEAFDTHQTAASPVPPPERSSAPPPGTPYEPHAPPQQYYPPPPALAVNDGYEHELGYYMSDGVPPPMQQSWAGGGDMYGY
jgi:hypothetical protein